MPRHSPAMDSAWFKNRMKELGVTQEALGTELGRDRDKVRRILGGTQTMRIDEALTFATMLDVSYQEIVERALGLANGSLSFGKRDRNIPVRYRVAAAESNAGPFDLGPKHPMLTAPPKWQLTPNAFAAEVADNSFDRRYPQGTLLYCVPPEELLRPLRAGDACVLLHLTKGRPFEARGGIITPAPGRDGFVVVGASFDQKFALSIWFDQDKSNGAMHETRGGFEVETPPSAEFDYQPSPRDNATIIGIVTAALRPEA